MFWKFQALVFNNTFLAIMYDPKYLWIERPWLSKQMICKSFAGSMDS